MAIVVGTVLIIFGVFGVVGVDVFVEGLDCVFGLDGTLGIGAFVVELGEVGGGLVGDWVGEGGFVVVYAVVLVCC